MKRQGIKMKWVEDDYEGNLWESGFGISEIAEDKIDKIKKVFGQTKN